ncbi:hypothetical protein [Actimicrobium sp. CCI2.3]|uniref:hypothetical protein n=1 Tax=Actimicrobium sp. CCI2.3 TaxID=3048616 RepID=UPI002AB570C2|nr:hypothetical protein [Actimicrobium sp. CCI2.3]MDY7573756.1 hypothetical protein [Actimicrobium sp. CCI2.3]MEB0022367.1 hypothetical protein [Actimicrobium sp. CCI2.3]
MSGPQSVLSKNDSFSNALSSPSSQPGKTGGTNSGPESVLSHDNTIGGDGQDAKPPVSTVGSLVSHVASTASAIGGAMEWTAQQLSDPAVAAMAASYQNAQAQLLQQSVNQPSNSQATLDVSNMDIFKGMENINEGA